MLRRSGMNWCETCCLKLREEHRLRASEKGVLGEYLDQVTGGWIKLHKEENHHLHSSLNIRMIK
jgi:hypothetical protein